jgi:hypothetical protein
MRKAEFEVYKFEELPEKVQKTLIDKNRYTEIEDTCWNEFILDDATETLELLGFSDVKIRFSGFYSQGDGASFIGEWKFPVEFADDSYSPIIDQPLEFQELAKILRQAKDNEFKIVLGHNSNLYCHERTVEFQFENDNNLADEIRAACRAVMQEIYRALEKEYDEYTSDEFVKKALISFEDEYFIDGRGA